MAQVMFTRHMFSFLKTTRIPLHISPFTTCSRRSMLGIIDAVFLVLLTSVPALARRIKHLKKVRFETDIVEEEGKNDTIEGAKRISLVKDKLDLQTGGLEHAAWAQGATAQMLMQEVQRGDASFKEVGTHNVAQATGDAMAEFLSALNNVFGAIYTEVKTGAKAELHKNMDPGSGNARESKKEAAAAAAALIAAETLLCERTELLAGEAFGGEKIVKYMLEGYDKGKDRTVKTVLERLHMMMQIEQLAIKRLGVSPKDIVGFEKLLTRLSAVEGRVEAMQGQESDSEEIDLTNPLLLEANAMYLEIVKFMPEILKVQLNSLRRIVEKKTMLQGGLKAVQGVEVRPKMTMKLMFSSFAKEVDKIEQRLEMGSIIRNAIDKFARANVLTPTDYALAIGELGQAVNETIEKLEQFDPEMYENQKARIKEALKEKQMAMENVPH